MVFADRLGLVWQCSLKSLFGRWLQSIIGKQIGRRGRICRDPSEILVRMRQTEGTGHP